MKGGGENVWKTDAESRWMRWECAPTLVEMGRRGVQEGSGRTEELSKAGQGGKDGWGPHLNTWTLS